MADVIRYQSAVQGESVGGNHFVRVADGLPLLAQVGANTPEAVGRLRIPGRRAAGIKKCVYPLPQSERVRSERDSETQFPSGHGRDAPAISVELQEALISR